MKNWVLLVYSSLVKSRVLLLGFFFSPSLVVRAGARARAHTYTAIRHYKYDVYLMFELIRLFRLINFLIW